MQGLGASVMMPQTMAVPALVLAMGLVAALCFARPRHLAPRKPDVETRPKLITP